MELEYKHIPFEIKDLKGDGSFEGYGAYFGNVDLGKDVCDRKAFDATIQEHQKAGTMPAMLYSHDTKEPIGDWSKMTTDNEGLVMAGNFWVGKGIPKAEQGYMLAKSRTPKGLSIGYITRNSRNEKSGTRTLLDLSVKEVSLTLFPMNPKAVITAIKSLMADKQSLTIREAEEILRDVGFSNLDAKAFLARVTLGFKQRDAGDRDLCDAFTNITNILKGK